MYAARVASSDGEGAWTTARGGVVSDLPRAVVEDGVGIGTGVGVWVGDSTGTSSSGVGGDMAGVQHEKAHRLGFRIGWGRGCPCRGLPDPDGPLSRFSLNSTIFLNLPHIPSPLRVLSPVL
jgi:hypothetical protein